MKKENLNELERKMFENVEVIIFCMRPNLSRAETEAKLIKEEAPQIILRQGFKPVIDGKKISEVLRVGDVERLYNEMERKYEGLKEGFKVGNFLTQIYYDFLNDLRDAYRCIFKEEEKEMRDIIRNAVEEARRTGIRCLPEHIEEIYRKGRLDEKDIEEFIGGFMNFLNQYIEKILKSHREIFKRELSKKLNSVGIKIDEDAIEEFNILQLHDEDLREVLYCLRDAAEKVWEELKNYNYKDYHEWNTVYGLYDMFTRHINALIEKNLNKILRMSEAFRVRFPMELLVLGAAKDVKAIVGRLEGEEIEGVLAFLQYCAETGYLGGEESPLFKKIVEDVTNIMVRDVCSNIKRYFERNEQKREERVKVFVECTYGWVKPLEGKLRDIGFKNVKVDTLPL